MLFFEHPVLGFRPPSPLREDAVAHHALAEHADLLQDPDAGRVLERHVGLDAMQLQVSKAESEQAPRDLGGKPTSGVDLVDAEAAAGEGARVEPAIWAENIPFNETRDYVKKVLSNAAVYASLLSGRALSLKSWLGPQAIGPRDVAAPAVNVDLP